MNWGRLRYITHRCSHCEASAAFSRVTRDGDVEFACVEHAEFGPPLERYGRMTEDERQKLRAAFVAVIVLGLEEEDMEALAFPQWET